MKIRYLTIQNFRGIRKLKNLEIGNLNTFVGKNDSGKSIILKALDCFFNEKIFNEKDFFKGKKKEEKTSIQISFLLEKEVDDLLLDKNKLLTIKKEYSIDDKGKIKIENFYLSNDFEDEKYQDLWSKKESDLNKKQEELKMGVVRSGRGNTNLGRIELIKSMLTKLPRKEKFNLFGNDFLKKLDENYSILLPEYYLFDADESLDVGSTEFQSNFRPIITSCFEKHKETTRKIEEEIKTELHREFEEIRKLMSKNVSGLKQLTSTLSCDWKKSVGFDINFNFDGEEYSVPISHKGTGFKRLLMVAYFEYLANKEKINDKIFAIEEPETYLHPSAQEDLLNSILTLSENSQFFITTHSPIFAGASKGGYSILVKKNTLGISEYYRAEDTLKEIITELGIKAEYNLLENTRCVLFVEGKDDVEFVRIASKTFLNKDFESEGICIMIGGGSSLKNSADLGLLKKLNRKYVVLKDGDIGDETKKKEKEKIKAICVSDGAFFHELKKREIENYCEIERIREVYSDVANIANMQIAINDSTDVENYLKGVGLSRFKSNKSLEVFRKMDISDWKKVDPDDEIKSFLETVYSFSHN